MRNDEAVAEVMFRAYNDSSPNPWKSYDGLKDVPKWEGLTDGVRTKWKAAARAAIDAVTK